MVLWRLTSHWISATKAPQELTTVTPLVVQTCRLSTQKTCFGPLAEHFLSVWGLEHISPGSQWRAARSAVAGAHGVSSENIIQFFLEGVISCHSQCLYERKARKVLHLMNCVFIIYAIRELRAGFSNIIVLTNQSTATINLDQWGTWCGHWKTTPRLPDTMWSQATVESREVVFCRGTEGEASLVYNYHQIRQIKINIPRIPTSNLQRLWWSKSSTQI